MIDGQSFDWNYIGWEAFGLFGYGMFFARLVVQWVLSERAGKPVLPLGYWILSLFGVAMVCVYAWHKASVAMFVPQLVGGVFYIRNLQLELRHRAKAAAEAAALDINEPHADPPSASVDSK